MIRLCWFIVFLLIAASCFDEPDCFQLNNDVIVLNFKIIGFDADALRITGVDVSDSEFDFVTPIMTPDTLVSSIALPLNPLKSEIEYTLKTSTGDRILDVGYQRLVQFVSANCGERYIFSHLAVADHDFDSVNVVNGTPTTNPSSNINFYRCAVTNQMGVTYSSKVGPVTVKTYYGPTVIFKDSVEEILLPLNPKTDTTSFVFEHSDGSVKKVSVRYRNKARIFAPQCGTQQILDSLKIVSSSYPAAKVSNINIQDLPVSNLAITP